MRDPGLDRHTWETQWQALEDELEDAPAETLPEMADLVERMLRDRGFPLDDDVADDGVEPEVLVNYRSARDIATRVERGDDVDPAEIGQAIHNLRDIYGQLIERPDN
ncbi:MAG: hypothetical protein M3188_03575 [Actinomycetota bacterium]|nr:hypothetical protein [Actinomycetota bacterium]